MVASQKVASAGRGRFGGSQHNNTSQQTAAPAPHQQAGAGSAPGGGGAPAGVPAGVPPLLLQKGYDVLGIIGEVAGCQASVICVVPALSCPLCRRSPVQWASCSPFAHAGHLWAGLPGAAPGPPQPLPGAKTHEAAAGAGHWNRTLRLRAAPLCGPSPAAAASRPPVVCSRRRSTRACAPLRCAR